MLAALLPLILGIAPQLAEHLFGSKGGDIAAQVAGAVTAVTGPLLAETVAVIAGGVAQPAPA